MPNQETDKLVWRPSGLPLTDEERKDIGAHERLQAAHSPSLYVADRERRLAHIAAFERGETDDPVPPADDVPATVRVVPRKYLVHWGWMLQRTEEFTDFQRSLEFYVDHKGGPCGARVTGEGYDADWDEGDFREVADGLTDEERERVEEIT